VEVPYPAEPEESVSNGTEYTKSMRFVISVTCHYVGLVESKEEVNKT